MTEQKSDPPTQPPIAVRMLPIDRLVPTPDNRRKPGGRTALQSLARSIARDGVLQPLVVRVHPTLTDRWEIRAGERRWQAAKLAGLQIVPVIVRELDDADALTVTVAENLLRENLHPLEEAEAIQQAFDRGFDLKVLAARLGKSVRHLARRAALTRLSPCWRRAIQASNSEASRLSAAHLELR